ncbi:Hypothetical predicted protein [Mytilus galloprovincialis]|uniref:Integrase catalytic domain-containing protein n=1 Tax=Mytilus galloprovincialis TaxID=29158 RepID=A0A8B6ELJ2_MYTGA|nr:Hypothetical predicted protein [Mytilus galloprovincialis]
MQSCLDYELIKLGYSTETTCTSDSDPITKSSVLKEYSDIFKGVGLVHVSGKATIHIDSKVPPVVHPPRRVPVALRGRLKSELHRMENADIIGKVNGPILWVTSLVVVEKPNGKLRVCLDPKDLNSAIQRTHYPMRTLEDILPQLSNAHYLTKLDVRSGYWTISLRILLPLIHRTFVTVSSVCHLVSIAHKTFFKRRLTSATQNLTLWSRSSTTYWFTDQPVYRLVIEKIEEIEKATLVRPQFDILKSVILEGWPQCRSECPAQVLEFWNHRDELSVKSGIIFKGHKIVIQTSLRALMLDKIHTGYMGVEKCIRRARDVLFWPKMSLHISDMVFKCSVCLERRNYNAKESLEPHKIPQYPWQIVATDLFYWNNADYIVIVDYYILYLEVHKLHGTTSTTVINKLKGTFSRLGIPETVVSDNGPQYSSQEFSEFAKKIGF